MKTDIFKSQFWVDQRIRNEQISKYQSGGRDFIDDDLIEGLLAEHKDPEPARIREILVKSLLIETLSLKEVALLLSVSDQDMLQEMRQAAFQIKLKVYDNRIVTFAPLYMGNYCVNNCAYCGFRIDNKEAKRRVLSMDEIRREVEILTGQIGHKRLIVVYGEHPLNDIDYIIESIKTIYSVQVKTKKGVGNIRRVNVNAPAFSIEDLRKLKDVGIGTYQVFQETYQHKTYGDVHPADTVKGHYGWRLYCMHRAFEAGIDDVGIGALFGLTDWRFEVMGLVAHAHELEHRFGIGPHTVSFPRLEPAANAPLTRQSPFLVSDEDFRKLILVLRLAIPYTGMIITAREKAEIRREALQMGITQTDASTRIGIGAYSDTDNQQQSHRQQFLLGDTRSLDEVIREFAQMGFITSFCTAGYRCGRTGKCIMDLLRSGDEGKFCKLNAVLTFQEWLDDFASPQTKAIGDKVITKEIEEIKTKLPRIFSKFTQALNRVKAGERDVYF